MGRCVECRLSCGRLAPHVHTGARVSDAGLAQGLERRVVAPETVVQLDQPVPWTHSSTVRVFDF